MRSRVPIQLTQKEWKALRDEIRTQCLEQTEQYEVQLDVVVLYAINRVFRKGKKELEYFYSEMFKLREEMKEYYGSGDDEGMGDFAMYIKLKEKGIDVQKMYEEQAGSRKFKVKVK
jgi:hypothetical protein